MEASSIEGNLLFGILALRNGLIDEAGLIAGFRAWTQERNRPFAEHLYRWCQLDAQEVAALDALMSVHLKKHAGDAEKSLASLPVSRAAQESLTALEDPEVQSTLSFLAPEGTALVEANPESRGGFVSASSASERFQILRPHAQGGLGAVYLASDRELNREVALKQILDRHADDKGSRARFMLEAEITGGLEHPGIVPVYSLGSYPGGRPFYAMRFIRGESLKEAIEAFHKGSDTQRDASRRSFELRRLLRRFLDVCNAIDYAHSRGILHRDIKPSNVVLGKHGETLVVDWGLAKALRHAETGASSEERVLGPSSFSGSAETLPGFVLGTPAYMSPEQAAGELEQLGPRSDVYSLGATLHCLLTGKAPFESDDHLAVLGAVKTGAFLPPRQLDPAIDRALEAVCRKAMALHPEDRYPSARALAEDIERWMADEPVTAWQDPLARRIGRWARRNRGAVMAAAAAMLMGLAGGAIVLAVLTKSNLELKAANLDLALANARVSQANIELQGANQREAARFRLAMDAIRTFHTGVSAELLLKETQFAGLRTRLLRGAAAFYGRLEPMLKNQTDRRSRAALGAAYAELGNLTDKIGSKPEALAIQRKALAVRRELARDTPSEIQLVQTLLAVGNLCAQTADAAAAQLADQEAISIAERLFFRDQHSPDVISTLASALSQAGSLCSETGKAGDARSLFERARSLRSTLVDANPRVGAYQADLAATDISIADLLVVGGKPLEALPILRRALSNYQRLSELDSVANPYGIKLANTHYNIALALSRIGNHDEAIAAYEQARAIYQRLSSETPNATVLQNYLSDTFNNMGNENYRLSRNGEAKRLWEEGLAVRKQLAESNPSVIQFQSNLASSYDNLAEFMTETSDLAHALEYSEKGLTIRAKVAAAEPSVVRFQHDLSTSFLNIGSLKARTGDESGALDSLERALATQQGLADTHPSDIQIQRDLAVTHAVLGRFRRQFGRLSPALASYRDAVTIVERLPTEAPSDHYALASYHAALAGIAAQSGSGLSAREASAEAEHAIRALRSAAAAGYRNLGQLRDDTALNSLRSRPDFQHLLLDMAFPRDPMAR
jgi:serine/threonine-protein kinase